MEKLQVSTVRSETVTELESSMNQCCSHQVEQESLVLYLAASSFKQALEHLSTLSTNITPSQSSLLPGECCLGKVDLLLFIHGIQTQKQLRLP